MSFILSVSHTNEYLYKMRVCFFIVSSMYYILSMSAGVGSSPREYLCIYICRFSAYNVNLHICSCLVSNIVSIIVELMSCCLSCHICSHSADTHIHTYTQQESITLIRTPFNLCMLFILFRWDGGWEREGDLDRWIRKRNRNYALFKTYMPLLSTNLQPNCWLWHIFFSIVERMNLIICVCVCVFIVIVAMHYSNVIMPIFFFFQIYTIQL